MLSRQVFINLRPRQDSTILLKLSNNNKKEKHALRFKKKYKKKIIRSSYLFGSYFLLDSQSDIKYVVTKLNIRPDVVKTNVHVMRP